MWQWRWTKGLSDIRKVGLTFWGRGADSILDWLGLGCAREGGEGRGELADVLPGGVSWGGFDWFVSSFCFFILPGSGLSQWRRWSLLVGRVAEVPFSFARGFQRLDVSGYTGVLSVIWPLLIGRELLALHF